MSANVVTVTVSGPVGCGKSAILGEIEIALRAIGVPVETDAAHQAEKNATHADWQEALDLYRPAVMLREVCGRNPAPELLKALMNLVRAEEQANDGAPRRSMERALEEARAAIVTALRHGSPPPPQSRET